MASAAQSASRTGGLVQGRKQTGSRAAVMPVCHVKRTLAHARVGSTRLNQGRCGSQAVLHQCWRRNRGAIRTGSAVAMLAPFQDVSCWSVSIALRPTVQTCSVCPLPSCISGTPPEHLAHLQVLLDEARCPAFGSGQEAPAVLQQPLSQAVQLGLRALVACCACPACSAALPAPRQRCLQPHALLAGADLRAVLQLVQLRAAPRGVSLCQLGCSQPAVGLLGAGHRLVKEAVQQGRSGCAVICSVRLGDCRYNRAGVVKCRKRSILPQIRPHPAWGYLPTRQLLRHCWCTRQAGAHLRCRRG